MKKYSIDTPVTDILPDWKTPDSYDLDFAPLPNCCGVYVIIAMALLPENGNGYYEVAYVGKSRNLERRLRRSIHQAIREVERAGFYAKRFFLACDISELDARERDLIEKLDPVINIQLKART